MALDLEFRVFSFRYYGFRLMFYGFRFRIMGSRFSNYKVKAYGFVVYRCRVRGGRISEY